MPDENDSQKEITVAVTAPADDPTPDEAPAPTVVVIEGEAPAATPPDLLSVLLEMKAEIAELRNSQLIVTEVAVEADAKAESALQADAIIMEDVADTREAVAAALEEDQAPADADVEPVKAHWLHR